MQSMRRDPAPSRWAWRLERLMLTPGVRLALRVGLPFVLTLGLGTWYFSKPDVQMAIVGTVNELRASIEQRPEFMVNLMAIDGADAEVSEAIRAELPIDFPVSSFDLDLEAMRDSLIAMGPVKSASLRIRAGGILQVDVTPREPIVVWRSADGLQLLDAEGHPIGPVETRSERSDLPLIVGVGADRHVPEALRLIRAAEPLGQRFRGLQRMGERRWDVVLDRDQRVLLPAKAPLQALERMIALDKASDMLDRDIANVDFRLAARPTIRMQQDAFEERLRLLRFNHQSE